MLKHESRHLRRLPFAESIPPDRKARAHRRRRNLPPHCLVQRANALSESAESPCGSFLRPPDIPPHGIRQQVLAPAIHRHRKDMLRVQPQRLRIDRILLGEVHDGVAAVDALELNSSTNSSRDILPDRSSGLQPSRHRKFTYACGRNPASRYVVTLTTGPCLRLDSFAPSGAINSGRCANTGGRCLRAFKDQDVLERVRQVVLASNDVRDTQIESSAHDAM